MDKLFNLFMVLVDASSKSHTFMVGVGLHQGCPLSHVLFFIFMYLICRCRCSGGVARDLRIRHCLRIMLLSWPQALQRFTDKSEAAGMRISTSRSKAVELSQKSPLSPGRGGRNLEQQSSSSRILFTSEGSMEIDMQIEVAAKVIRTVVGLLL